MKFFREAWQKMDTFDRVYCTGMSAFAFVSCTALALFVAHGWMKRLAVFAVGIALGKWPWYQIPQESLRLRMLGSICGDNSGHSKFFCVLEPEHLGDHKHFHSSGGCIGWPNRKGGA